MPNRIGWMTVTVRLAFAVLLGIACDDDPTPSFLTGPSSSADLRIVSGNNQTGKPGERLSLPMTIVAVGNQDQPVRDVVVRFLVTEGGGTLSDSTGVTAFDGRAQTYLTLGPSPGINKVAVTYQGLEGLPPTFTAEAEGAETDGGAPLVSGRSPDADHFSLAVERLNLPGGVQFGLTNRITAFVFDASSNPVPEGTLVLFQTTGGGIERSAKTDASGQASVSLLTAEPVPDDGRVTLTAETSAGADSSLSVQTQVIFSGPTVVRMDQPGNFSPSSDEWLTCLLYVGDANGHPLSAGTRVRVTAVGGSVSGQTDVLLPDTLDPDATRFTVQFRSAPGGGQARMTVSVTSPNGDLTQTFTGGLAPAGGQTGSQEPVSILLALKDTVLVADGKATTAVRASVLDSAGAGIPGVTVRFETSLGRLSSLSVPTDEDGVAETILVAGIEAGKASVVAASGQDLSTLASATFIRGTPTSIVLIDVTPASIGVRGAGGNETAIVTFEVRDQWGNTVADGESIFFRLDAPGQGDEKVGPDQAATVAGRAQAALSSGTVARTVRLVAEVAIAPGDTIRSTPVPIAIHGGPPDLTHFSLTAEPVNLAGRVLYGLESTITAFVFDKYSNPVPLGTSVRFRTNGGGVQGSSETNIDGQTSVTLFTAQPVPPEADSYLATVTGQTVDEAGQEIETSTTVLFSGPTAPIEITGGGADTISSGSLFIPEGRFQIVTFTVSDISGNPIMGGSTITVTSDVAVVSGHANVLVPDARSGNTSYGIVISDPVPFEDPPAPPARGSVLITVTSPNGNEQLTFGLTAD